jgi:hypothetical protein
MTFSRPVTGPAHGEDTSAHDQRTLYEEQVYEGARKDITSWVTKLYGGDVAEVLGRADGDAQELMCECVRLVLNNRVAGQRNPAVELIEKLAAVEADSRIAAGENGPP